MQDLYVFGSPKNTEGYQFSKTFFGVIFANNPNLEESLPIKHAAPLQDAGVTARRPLDFTASQAVCRLTQVPKGRGAKRGELRGAALAGQGRAAPRQPRKVGPPTSVGQQPGPIARFADVMMIDGFYL